MTTLTLDIPDDVLRSLRLPEAEVEQELKKDLAVILYARGALSLGPARELAGLTRWEFEELLGKRQAPRHYGPEDVDEDLAYAEGD